VAEGQSGKASHCLLSIVAWAVALCMENSVVEVLEERVDVAAVEVGNRAVGCVEVEVEAVDNYSVALSMETDDVAAVEDSVGEEVVRMMKEHG